MTKSLRDKLKELFFPENVPAYNIELLADLFSVAFIHTLSSEICNDLKENKNTEDKKNKYILWQDELNKLEKEKNSFKSKFDCRDDLFDTLKNKNPSYQEAVQRYENYKSPNEK